MYTIRYEIKEASKTTSTVKSQTFTVKNTMKLPTVSVNSRIADSLNDADIIANLSTDVDMNNNTSEHESIVKLDGTKTNSNNTKTVKYAVVEDTYGNGTWHFFIPINATFRYE